jgi:sugar phosphate isomerase/epimerase
VQALHKGVPGILTDPEDKHMQVAIQTISWGPRPDNIEGMLQQIKAAGYEGAEFAQHPDVLGTPEQLHKTMSGLGLQFVGMAGGDLAERIGFVGKIIFAEISRVASRKGNLREKLTRPYVYVDDWEVQGAQEALAAKVTLALHPHMFKSVQTAQEAEELLAKHPELSFLPDTAHLTVAGEDVVAVLMRNYHRIAAIHLKDWTAEFGRAYQFYSRGFTELGKGDVLLHRIMRFLKERAYHGWLVVEQEAAENPPQSAAVSRLWLRNECGI